MKAAQRLNHQICGCDQQSWQGLSLPFFMVARAIRPVRIISKYHAQPMVRALKAAEKSLL
jgi:hypothetical protein